MTTQALSSVLALLLLASCSAAREDAEAPAVAFANQPADSYDWTSRRAGTAPPDVAALEAERHGRLVVPPDRALVRIDATVPASSRAAAETRVRAAAGQLAEALADGEACAVSVLDFGTPSGAGDAWRARASLALDVPLTGAADAGERLARIERCMRRFGALGASLRDAELSVSDPLVTVDAPWRHRRALLDRALEPLREVAAVDDAPAAFDPAGLRCSSRGHVSIVARSLRGVALEVDLACRPRDPAPAPEPAAPTPS